jgi:uncharacterized protein
MKSLIYLLSGTIFGIGLSLSGMIDPVKIKNFLAIDSPDWSAALIVVLGSAVIIYFSAYYFVRLRKKTFNGARFVATTPKPIDKKLVLGSILFGIGWGIAGICPGPALVHIAFLGLNFAVFILAMFAGFELQKRLS